MHRSLRFAFAALLVLPAPLLAQNSDKPVLVKPTDKPAPTTTITAESRLVNIPVIVRDNKGALVQNLTKADFSLQVDGKPQIIRYFDLDNNLPLTLGLLVDTSESQRNALDDERSASSAFLDQMLTGKQDQAFVIEFARSVELLQELTGSRAKLQAGPKNSTSRPPRPLIPTLPAIPLQTRTAAPIECAAAQRSTTPSFSLPMRSCPNRRVARR